MRWYHWVVLGGLARFLVGCGPNSTGVEGVTLSVAGPTYSVGDTAWMELQNHTSLTLQYNLCMAALQRSAGAGTWASVERRPEGGACILALSTLEPEEMARGPQLIHSSLPSGEYRFVAQVWLGDRPEDVASGLFRITR